MAKWGEPKATSIATAEVEENPREGWSREEFQNGDGAPKWNVLWRPENMTRDQHFRIKIDAPLIRENT